MDPYIGEVRIFAFDYAPETWARCDAQSVAVAQYTALYAVVGNTYGGNNTFFLLPDLRGRVALGSGTGREGGSYILGKNGGSATAQLDLGDMPAHNHGLQGVKGPSTDTQPSAQLFPGVLRVSDTQAWMAYKDGAAPTTPVSMNPVTIQQVGHGSAHNNLQPYLNTEFCIAFEGIFPVPPS